MKTSWPTMAILMTLTVAAAAEFAQAQDERSSPVTSTEIAGTLLVLRPNFSYQQAVLRVVGPGGYEARQSFEEGSVVSLDLLGAGKTQKREVPGVEDGLDGPRSLLALPDGHYRYEAVFFTGVSGPARVSGHLFVRGGSLYAVPPPEEEAAASVEAAPGLAPEPRSLTEPEQLTLTDVNDNGLTRIELQADNATGGRLENWQIENRQGDFHIVEDGTGSQNQVHLAILQDTGETRVGIGTIAPAAPLHVAAVASTFTQAALRIEDLGSGGTAWDLEVVGSGGLVIGEVGRIPLWIKKGATTFGLVLTGTGVGVGRTIPEARLHVAGDARLDGELSVLSSKTAKENFVPVDSRAVLARLAELPIQEWSYREGDGFRHLGPVAEDFHEVFSLGKSELSINPLDISGVALAAIQGLRAARWS